LFTISFVLFANGAISGALDTAKIDWIVVAHADGEHNAFTDLIRWKNAYYLCFRHGESHLSMDGEIRVMTSPDLKTWTPCGTLDTYGDDRDSKLVATDDTLYVYFGVWDLKHAPDHGTPDRGMVRSHFATTTDGKTWSPVRGVYEPGWWLWRVSRHNGEFWSAAYTARRPKPEVRETRLLRSADGLEWTLHTVVTNRREAGEADLLWRRDGAVWLITRANDEKGVSMLFRSDADMKHWIGADLNAKIHSPVFATWKDRVFIAGRDYDRTGSKTKIWELIDGQVIELITLPSAGDTGYPGLLVDPATADARAPAFFVSWYSQHEYDTGTSAGKNAANVYVARVQLI
jgi:hypothetical protein